MNIRVLTNIRFVRKRGHRQRNDRTRDGLEEYANELIKVGEEIITQVEAKLRDSAD